MDWERNKSVVLCCTHPVHWARAVGTLLLLYYYRGSILMRVKPKPSSVYERVSLTPRPVATVRFPQASLMPAPPPPRPCSCARVYTKRNIVNTTLQLYTVIRYIACKDQRNSNCASRFQKCLTEEPRRRSATSKNYNL